MMQDDSDLLKMYYQSVELTYRLGYWYNSPKGTAVDGRLALVYKSLGKGHVERPVQLRSKSS